MLRIKHFSATRIVGASILVATGIFILDLSLPLGVAGGVPYVALIMISLYSPWRHYVFILAVVGTVLTILGYFFSPPAGIFWMVIVNRLLALFAIWLTAFFCRQRKQTKTVLGKANEVLQQEIVERQRVEQALSETKKRFHSIFDDSHDGIFVIDPERDEILEANRAACHMLEYTREELLSAPISTIHPKGMSKLETFTDSVLDKGKGWTDELTCISKSGQLLPVEISASRIGIDERNCVLASVRDVTESGMQKRQQVAVQQIRAAIWKMKSVDEADQLLNALGTALEMAGIPFYDCGINWVDTSGIAPTAHQYYTEERLWRTVEDKDEMDMILELWHAGGPTCRPDLATDDVFGEQDYINEEFGTSIRSVVDVPFAQGTLAVKSTQQDAFSELDIAFIQKLVDVVAEGFLRLDDLRSLEQHNQDLEKEIIERRQMEQVTQVNLALQRVRNQILLMNGDEGWELVVRTLNKELREWIDYFNCGINILDRSKNTRISYAITHGAGVVRREMDDIHPLLLHTVETGVPLYRRNRTEIERWKPLRIGEMRSVVDVPIRDGTLVLSSTRENAFNERDIDLLEQFAPVVSEGVRRLKDLTEYKRMEEEIRKNQNLESLGVLAGGIAHDFNNVLTGVIGSLTLLEMLLDKDSDAHQIAVDGIKAADRTRDLTQQLLTFAKGGTPIKEVTSIEVLIRETTELSLHGSNTKPEYHLAENLHSVHIDQGQIGQVIQNLVLNADQAMPDGGMLKVSAENIELSAQNLFPLAAGPYVKVSVVDQGIGMTAEVITRIFDPYFSTKTAGHGLGLSITHSIIQRHDGHIAVHSEIDVGTTFELYLPALQEHALTATEQEQEFAHGTGSILLMDDEDAIHRTVGRMLNSLGYDVESVYDGQDALQEYNASLDRGKAYDIVIMDLTVPGGMGGQKAVGKLHEMDPEIRVIVSSGYAHDPVMADYADYGFAGKITKPVDMQELAETVKSVLEGGE
ncbi:MAG: hypothetical protein CMN78_02025 [Spirochaetales bacterium]|nr:hypothetical protein [Spirochaetales bacterium]